MTNKIYVNWEEFHQDTINLSQKIKQDGNYNKIVAISRGGLLPAGILAYELDIRNTQAINISSYDGEHQRSLDDVEVCDNVGVVDDKTLIVDDLSDTGSTYKLLRNRFPNARYVTVYAKPKGQSVVDIFSREMPDEWLVFPWD